MNTLNCPIVKFQMIGDSVALPCATDRGTKITGLWWSTLSGLLPLRLEFTKQCSHLYTCTEGSNKCNSFFKNKILGFWHESEARIE